MQGVCVSAPPTPLLMRGAARTTSGEDPYHLREPSRRDNVAGVHQAVQVPGRLFYRLAHLVVAVEIEDVGHQVQRILVVLHLRVEAGEVEPVGQVVLVDFAKVLIAARRYELAKAKGC